MRLPLLLFLFAKVTFCIPSLQLTKRLITNGPLEPDKPVELDTEVLQQILKSVFPKSTTVTPYEEKETLRAEVVNQPNNKQLPIYQNPLSVQNRYEWQEGGTAAGKRVQHQHPNNPPPNVRSTKENSYHNKHFSQHQLEESIPLREIGNQQLVQRHGQAVYQPMPQHFPENGRQQRPYIISQQHDEEQKYVNNVDQNLSQQHLQLLQIQQLQRQQQQKQHLLQQQLQIRQQQQQQQHQQHHQEPSHFQQPPVYLPIGVNKQHFLQQYNSYQMQENQAGSVPQVQGSPVPQNTFQPQEQESVEDDDNQEHSILHYVPQNSQQRPEFAASGNDHPSKVQGIGQYLYRQQSQDSQVTQRSGSPYNGLHHSRIFPIHQRQVRHQPNDEESRHPSFYYGEPPRSLHHATPSVAEAENEEETPAAEPQHRTLRTIQTGAIKLIRSSPDHSY